MLQKTPMAQRLEQTATEHTECALSSLCVYLLHNPMITVIEYSMMVQAETRGRSDKTGQSPRSPEPPHRRGVRGVASQRTCTSGPCGAQQRAFCRLERSRAKLGSTNGLPHELG